MNTQLDSCQMAKFSWGHSPTTRYHNSKVLQLLLPLSRCSVPKLWHHVAEYDTKIKRAIFTQVPRCKDLRHRRAFDLTPFSSRAANGLLMLLTNLLTCSKCLVISVARTMSMMACRSDLYSFLERERQRRRVSVERIRTCARGENGVRWQCGKQHREACEQFRHSDCSDSSDEWMLCLLSSEGTSTCEPFRLGIQITLFLK